MLTPRQAHERLQQAERRAMDDPAVAHLAVRWWHDAEGMLCCAPWRGATTRYPEFVSVRVG